MVMYHTMNDAWIRLKPDFDPYSKPTGTVIRAYMESRYQRYGSECVYVKTGDAMGGSWLVAGGERMYRERLSDQDLLILFNSRKYKYAWFEASPNGYPEKDRCVTDKALESAIVPVTWTETISDINIELVMIDNVSEIPPAIGIKFKKGNAHTILSVSDLTIQMYQLTENTVSNTTTECNVDFKAAMPLMSIPTRNTFVDKNQQLDHYNMIKDELIRSLCMMNLAGAYIIPSTDSKCAKSITTNSKLFEVYSHLVMDGACRHTDNTDVLMVVLQHPLFLLFGRPEYKNGGISRYANVVHLDTLPSMIADVNAAIESTVIINNIGSDGGRIVRNYHPDDAYFKYVKLQKEVESSKNQEEDTQPNQEGSIK